MTTDRCRVRGLGLLLLAVSASACAETPKTGLASDSLSRRERDSIIAGSKLPGAPVVRRALQVSDTLAARAARIDTGGR